MTVARLIEELQRQPPNHEVMVSASPAVPRMFEKDANGDFIETEFTIDDVRQEIKSAVIYV